VSHPPRALVVVPAVLAEHAFQLRHDAADLREVASTAGYLAGGGDQLPASVHDGSRAFVHAVCRAVEAEAEALEQVAHALATAARSYLAIEHDVASSAELP
jgi:hypothetical protein